MAGQTIRLATANNKLAAQLIERYQITQEKMDTAKNGRKWTRAQYQDYLATEHWQTKRAAAFKHYGRKCYLCGASGDDVQLDIHHNDYSRLGGEKMSDLVPLCRDCHERHHSSI